MQSIYLENRYLKPGVTAVLTAASQQIPWIMSSHATKAAAPSLQT